MARITTVACLVAALSAPLRSQAVSPAPTEPAAEPATAAVDQDPQDPAALTMPFAATLPQETLAVLGVADLAPHLPKLRSTGLYQLLAELEPPPEMAQALVLLDAQLVELGLDTDTLLRAASHGLAVALTGIDGDGRPRLALCADLGGDAEQLGAVLAQLTSGPDAEERVVQAATEGSCSIWSVLGTGGLQPAFCLHRNALLAGTDAELVADLVRRRDSTAPSLADDAAFAAFSAQAAAEGPPLSWCFVRPGELLNQLLPQMGGEAPEAARLVVQALDLERLESIGYSVRAAEGNLFDHLRIHWPEPRRGLLAALLGTGTQLSSTAFRGVPPGVTSFSLGNVNLRAVYDEVGNLVKQIEPRAWSMVQQGVAALRSNVGVDLELEVLGALGEQFVSLQWPSMGSQVNTAVLLEVRDTAKLGRALQRLLAVAGQASKPRTWRGHKVYELGASAPGIELCYSLTDSQLIVATSQEAMRSALSEADAADDNPHAMDMAARLPAGATWATRTELSEVVRSVLDGLEKNGVATPGVLRRLRAVLGGVRGAMEMTLALDADGISIQTQSPFGNAAGVAMAAAASAVALPAALNAQREARRAEAVRPDSRIRAAVGQIAAAQSKLHGSTGRYGDLDELVASGYLRADSIGTAEGDGVFREGSYLITVLLPTDEPERQRHYATLAWPSDLRIGTVLANTPTQPLMVNAAIAASLGIRRASLTDLYLNGRFGTPLVPGWRRVEDAPEVSTPNGDRALLEIILAAEKQGEPDVPREVIDALQATNPTVAARAAYALGELRVTAAVPQLCEALSSQPSVEVRRHAMAALRKIGDPRSAPASIEALDAEDALLRALAAAHLGELKEASAAEALLEVVASDDGSAEVRDRVAAILALTDVGAGGTLLSVAAAVTGESRPLGNALTFMFQTLCPKLDRASEAKVLLAVVEHPCASLRLFAAQRLGQLRAEVAVAPLTSRLASETDPKVKAALQLSLRALRDAGGEESPAAAIEAAWNGWMQELTPSERGVLGGGAGGLVVLGGGLLLWRSRRRRAAHADAAAAPRGGDLRRQLSAAYTEYGDSHAAHEEGYEDQGYADQGYADQGYADQGYEDQGYEDQGYEDHSNPGNRGAAARRHPPHLAAGAAAVGQGYGAAGAEYDASEASHGAAPAEHGAGYDPGLWDATVDVGEDYEAVVEED